MLFKIFLFFIISFNTLAKVSNVPNGIVKVFVQKVSYDYFRPWASPVQSEASGSGFIVEDKKIVTNAHVVADSTFIQVRKAGDFRKYAAKISKVAHDVDLAILEVEDGDFFKGTSALEIGDTPRVGDEVKAYGFPIGGDEMSLTKGVVSRVEMTRSIHSRSQLLGCDMDTSIAPGSSGGPVIKDDKVVGVSFQGSFFKEGGYMISAEVLKKVLSLYKKGLVYRVPDIGIEFQATENKNLRKWLGIDKLEGGILVTKVGDLSPAKGIIEEGDVILKIDDFEIAENLTVEFRRNERTSASYAYKRKNLGDEIKIRIFRKGNIMEKNLKLSTAINDVRYASETEYDTSPAFTIKGGVIFQPLVCNIVCDSIFGIGNKHIDQVVGKLREEEKEDFIIVNRVLEDENTSGYQVSRNIVSTINDEPIKTLKDVENVFKKDTVQHIIKLFDDTIIVIEAKDIDKETHRIAANYGIVKTSERIND